MRGKECGCSRCEYKFIVPFDPEHSSKKPRCPRCGSYTVNRPGCKEQGKKGSHCTGIFLP